MDWGRAIGLISLVFGTLIIFMFEFFEVDHFNWLKIRSRGLNAHFVTVDLPYCSGRKGSVSSNLEFPIFMITRDRVNTLRRAINSYKRLSSPYHLIICDHGSTYPPMLNYLGELALLGTKVWYIRQPIWKKALDEIARNITLYLKIRPHLRYYVVTDPDIGLNGTAPDVLLFFASILEACPAVDVIGPALKISNIPDYYNKKAVAYQHESQFWRSVPATATWKETSYHLAIQPIDTTFALRRSKTPFKPLKGRTIRAYAPYMAMHLDWYVNSSNPGEDYIWYIKHQSGINHWR